MFPAVLVIIVQYYEILFGTKKLYALLVSAKAGFHFGVSAFIGVINV